MLTKEHRRYRYVCWSFAISLCATAAEIPAKDVLSTNVIGQWSAEAKAEYLDAIGGDDGPGLVPKGFGSRAPWEHTEHQIGFLPIGQESQPIAPAYSIKADTNLTRIDVRLDKLRIYDYPGRGRHFVLLSFVAAHSPAPGTSAEHLTFNQVYEAFDSEGAGATGYPVFNGLNVGRAGATFRCTTVNVKNEADENALAFLKSGPVTQGLTLLETAQPAVIPFVELAKGIANVLLTRNQNVKVQEMFLGLDYDTGAAFGARLQAGNYIVLQAPDEDFSWETVEYRPADGRIVNKHNQRPVPYNYIVFRVTKH